MMGWYGFGYGMSGWGWLAMTISTVLFWGLLVTACVLLIRGWRHSSERSSPPAPPSPETLLAERFARGDIDEDEFHQRLTTLADARSASAGAQPLTSQPPHSGVLPRS